MTMMKHAVVVAVYGLLSLHTATAFQQPNLGLQASPHAATRGFPKSSFLEGQNRNRGAHEFMMSSKRYGNNAGLRMVNNNFENDDDSASLRNFDPSTLWVLGGIPALSLLFPVLLQAKLIVPLFIAKRVYIYLMAGTVVAIAATRGAAEDSPQLGTRLVDLTRDLLPDNDFSALDEDGNILDDNKKEDVRFQEMQVLDQVEGSTQAIGLPLIVVSSLVASLFFVLLQNTDFASMTAAGDADSSMSALQPLLESIQAIAPQLVTLSNGLVVGLFCRAELQRAATPATVSLVAALVLSALAYLGPAALVWPIQNLLCMCLAITVSRAIQLPSLGPILLALGGLVAYDVVSVGVQLVNLGTATMAAGDGGSGVSAAADAASSAMGAVALSKTAGMTSTSSWQPGLFQVQLRGSVSDLLGLGDAVFPSLLSTFLRRYDLDSEDGTKYFEASLAGFAGGCLACEFVPGIGSSGLPALLFIVPSMLTAVLGLALAQGNLGSLWAFDATGGDDEE